MPPPWLSQHTTEVGVLCYASCSCGTDQGCSGNGGAWVHVGGDKVAQGTLDHITVNNELLTIESHDL